MQQPDTRRLDTVDESCQSRDGNTTEHAQDTRGDHPTDTPGAAGFTTREQVNTTVERARVDDENQDVSAKVYGGP